MKKKTVTVDIVALDSDEFEGSLERVIERLTGWETEYGKTQGFSNLTIRDDSGFDGCSFMLTGTRIETDAEFKRRVKVKEKEKEKETAKEEKERQEYERLKAKFEEKK